MEADKPSFTTEVKSELANRCWLEEEHLPLIAGFFHLDKRQGEKIVAKTESAGLAKLFNTLVLQHFQSTISVDHRSHNPFSGRTVHRLLVANQPDFGEFLELSGESLLKEATIRPYLAGIFMSSGSISDPEKGNYNLHLMFDDGQQAERIAKKISSYPDERRMNFKVIKRKNRYAMYLKRSDQIANFLAFIGASIGMLNYENIRLTRDYLNNDNRWDICASVNYQRAVETGRKNLEDIAIVKERLGLGLQDERTKLLIEIREKTPDLSYQEIADEASQRGVLISKSSVSHIFKQLHELALRLKR